MDPAIRLFLIFYLALVGQIALHEGCHALAALLVGFRVKALAIGPLVFERGRRPRWEGSGVMGRCLVNLTGSPTLYRRVALFVAAGPLANLASAGLGALALSRLPAWGLARDLALGNVLAALLLGIGSLVPQRRKMASDGYVLLALARRDPAALGYWAFAAVGAAVTSGRAVRESGITRAFLAPLLPKEAAVGRAHFLSAMLALEEGDHPAARGLLEGAAAYPWDGAQPTGARVATAHRALLCVDLMLHATAFQALRLRDPVRARELLGESLRLYSRFKIDPGPLGLAEAAVLAAEGREPEAREALGQWETRLAGLRPALQSSHRTFCRWIYQELGPQLGAEPGRMMAAAG